MIEIVKLNKYFNRYKKNQIHVINNISLKIDNTGLVALLGPSGSGKTTLLNAIGGLDKVQKGKIYIDKKKITTKRIGKKDKIRNLNIGYIFQDYKLIESMSVYDNVALVLKMIGIKDKEEIKTRVNYCLEKVGMYRYKSRLAGMLSGGEKQRVGIARAIVKAPDIIIADEPTGNLDSKNSLEIMNIIKSISKEKLVILVTHEKDLANFYATRIIEIEDGTIIKDYENKHDNELDYRIENKFYLKDFKNHKNLKQEDINLNIYSNDDKPVDLNIVIKNGNIYIKTNKQEKIEVIDDNSSIEMVDEHYKKLNKEEVDKYKFDFENKINKNIKKRYSSIYNPITFITGGFKKVFDFSVLKKILLLGFFISAMFIMYSVASVYGTLKINDQDFIQYNKNYLQIKQPNMSVEDYLSYEQNENVGYMLPGDSKVNMPLQIKDYYQTNNTRLTISGSLASIRAVTPEQIVYGRMPATNKEIVIDKLIIEKDIAEGTNVYKMLGIPTVEEMLNRSATLDNIGELLIVGVVDSGSPSIYADDSMLINIIANMEGQSYYGYDMYTPQDEGNENTKVIDYELLKDDIVLKKGRLPENDYEVIVNYSHRYEMKLNKTINATVNDTKLKVVGYYESKENIDLYLVNNNTVKYKVIKEKDCFSVYPKSKEIVLNEFRDLNLYVEDTYENSKTEYIRQKREAMKTSLIVSAIILGISLVEIFLIIRSSFLSRIKEIGTLRAIGIKRKDIYKMFLGEIIAITTLASMPGILLMTYILKTLSSVHYMASRFIINSWVVILTIVFVYIFNIIIGILPVFRVLKKTPAQILSRQDI